MELVPRYSDYLAGYLGFVLVWNVDVIHDPYVVVSRVPVHGPDDGVGGGGGPSLPGARCQVLHHFLLKPNSFGH